MTNIIIGNVLSVVAAFFSIMSSSSRGMKKIYGYQALQCAAMVIASIFFASPTGVTTFTLCAVRNLFLMRDRLTGKLCVLIAALVTIVGLFANTRGLLGLLPILTTVIYTIGSYFFRKDFTIKINIGVNLILWGIYDIFVLDFVSLIMDTITVVVTTASLIEMKRHHR